MSTQIVCRECGTANQAGEDFCGECGTYLEWDGEATEHEPVAEAEHAPQGVVNAVLPGTARPKPRVPSAVPVDRPQPGDLVCERCGTGNNATRKFCRRCGGDLTEAEIPHIPWWRRVLRRRPRTRAAGSRPRQRRQRRVPWVAKFLAFVVVLAGIAYLAKPLWPPLNNTVLDRVKNVQPVTPASYAASSSASGHGPGRIHDGNTEHYWAPGTGGAGHPWVEARFRSPVRLVYLDLSLGASAHESRFLRNGRPTGLQATIVDSTGKAERLKVWRMADDVGFQHELVGRSDVASIRLTVVDAQPGGRRDSPPALGDVDFYVRR